MAVVLELPEEVEKVLREEAARAGLDTGQFVRDLVLERLSERSSPADDTPLSEAELLRRVSEGPIHWTRFHTLVSRRQAEALTPEEHAESIALSDQIERLNAQRIEHLAK